MLFFDFSLVRIARKTTKIQQNFQNKHKKAAINAA